MKSLSNVLKLAQEPIAICGNKIPDGDSVGSIVAVMNFLSSEKKKASALFFQEPVDTLEWMLDGIDYLLFEETNLQSFKTLIVVDDIFDSERLGLPCSFEGDVITIDHHLSNKEKHKGENVFWMDVPATACVLIEHGIYDPMLYVSMYTDTVSFTRRFTEVLPYVSILVGALNLIDKEIESYLLKLQSGISFDSLKALCLLSITAYNGVVKADGSEVIAIVAVSDGDLSENTYRQLIGTLRRYGNFIVLVNSESRKVSVRNETSLDALGLVGLWGGGGHKAACGMTLNKPVGLDVIRISNWITSRMIIEEVYTE